MPDDQVEKNLEETTQMPEPEEPLFPEDDEDEDENRSFEDTPSAETDKESPTLDEDTLKAIASQEESLTDQQSDEPEEENTSDKKLNDFDEAFYTAFHSEADEKKEDTLQEEEPTLPEEPEQTDDLGDSELKESDFSFEDDIKETTLEDSITEDNIENIEDEEISAPAESFPSDFPETEEKSEEINTHEEQFEEINASEEQPDEREEPKQTQPTFESKISSSTSDLQTDQLRKIIKASQLVNSNIKIDDVLQNVVTVATDLTNADRGTLYLIDRENNELWSKIAMGSETKEIRLKMGEGIAGWVAQNRETVNIEDVKEDERFSSDFDRSSGYETKSMLCFPIKNRDDVIVGVLQLLNSKQGKFSEQDEEFLSAISIQCALALQNAEMLEKLLKGERVSSLGKMTNFLIQDIKKPVLVSKRYAEHLKSKDINKDAAQIVEMILDQLTQVADLVQTTSSYAEGKAVLRTSRISFNEVINEFTDRLESFVKSKGSQVELNLGDDVKVQLDSKEFFQGYNHLIKNACDAMPDGGRIKVSTKADKNDVTLIVQDEGIGISENLIDKIFDPFMTHGKKEGTGLGLTITKKIVEGHSGTIEAESLLGEGSTIYIRLPKASAL